MENYPQKVYDFFCRRNWQFLFDYFSLEQPHLKFSKKTTTSNIFSSLEPQCNLPVYQAEVKLRVGSQSLTALMVEEQ